MFMSPCASTQITPSGLPVARTHGLGARGHRAGGHAVIAAEHHRQRARVERGPRHRVDTAADGGDVVDVLLADVALARELANGRRHVALDPSSRGRARQSARRGRRSAGPTGPCPRRAVHRQGRGARRSDERAASWSRYAAVLRLRNPATVAAVARPSAMQSGMPMARKPLPARKRPGSALRRCSMAATRAWWPTANCGLWRAQRVSREKSGSPEMSEQLHELLLGGLHQRRVVVALEAMRIAAAAEERAHQHVTRRAPGPATSRSPTCRRAARAVRPWAPRSPVPCIGCRTWSAR